MASAKEFKNRIKSIQSIGKITKAMKMVAASKLRQAQRVVEEIRPDYNATTTVYKDIKPIEEYKNKILIIPITSDRGLCGGINTSITKATDRFIKKNKDKEISILCIGDKGKDIISREHPLKLVKCINEISKKNINFMTAYTITEEMLKYQYDQYVIIYNKFRSVISQKITLEQKNSYESLIDSLLEYNDYEFESDKFEVLYDLFEYQLSISILNALLENATSEQGARMTAMDNASRNAGEMLDKLTLIYNKARQASITSELIEIISCASAVSK